MVVGNDEQLWQQRPIDGLGVPMDGLAIGLFMDFFIYFLYE